jgi:hypothetical protein
MMGARSSATRKNSEGLVSTEGYLGGMDAARTAAFNFRDSATTAIENPEENIFSTPYTYSCCCESNL